MAATPARSRSIFNRGNGLSCGGGPSNSTTCGVPWQRSTPRRSWCRSRILRRVVKRDRRLTWLGRTRPTCLRDSRQVPRRHRQRPGSGLAGDAEWPTIVLLIAQPEPEELAAKTPEVIRTEVWRRLFHAEASSGRSGFQSHPGDHLPLGLAERICRDRLDRVRGSPQCAAEGWSAAAAE